MRSSAFVSSTSSIIVLIAILTIVLSVMIPIYVRTWICIQP